MRLRLPHNCREKRLRLYGLRAKVKRSLRFWLSATRRIVVPPKLIWRRSRTKPLGDRKCSREETPVPAAGAKVRLLLTKFHPQIKFLMSDHQPEPPLELAERLRTYMVPRLPDTNALGEGKIRNCSILYGSTRVISGGPTQIQTLAYRWTHGSHIWSQPSKPPKAYCASLRNRLRCKG